MPPATRWDIFCTVIDNYGDIGIAWRLARQLSAEYGLSVRLWVDDLASFQRIRPEIDPRQPSQTLAGVDIRRWDPAAAAVPEPEVARVVIEALACQIPEPYAQAMARQDPKPVWINLEYLSAEDWIEGCHGLPSPHPTLPLVKYFFFPGWTPGTGGVLRESGLYARRDAFQASPAEQHAFWTRLGLPPPKPGEATLSLFAYENAALPELLQAWAGQTQPTRLLVPEGRPVRQMAQFFGATGAQPGDHWHTGQLTVHILPMLDQDEYDHLLWACDCNFVRGEDSFVRAQWAGRPLVWQAYRQEEDAHWPKIQAFLDRYTAQVQAGHTQLLDGHAPAPDCGQALATLWQAWNREQGAGIAWPAFWQCRQALALAQQEWNNRIRKLGDLADNLVHFCNEKL